MAHDEVLIKAVQKLFRHAATLGWRMSTSTTLDLSALRALDMLADGPLTMGQLGRLIELSAPATTQVVDRLAGEGLANRVQDQRDRRRVRVQLTDKAREFSQAELQPIAERAREVALDLDPSQQELVVSVLEALTSSIRRQ